MRRRIGKIRTSKGICHSIGITAGVAEMLLWSYYGGLNVPLSYGISADIAGTTLAPALEGFAISAGVLGGLSTATFIVAVCYDNLKLGVIAGLGAGLALSLMCTAIALAQYESLLIEEAVDGTIACIEVGCLVVGGLILVTEIAALALDKR